MDNMQRVLIVDDEVINLKILSELVSEEANVILAKSGEQAIRKARQYHPDLVLLDVKMPGMNGFETMSALRKDPLCRNIPVIFISGATDDDYAEKGLIQGAADYIFKPFHYGNVRARVRSHLQLARQTQQLENLARRDHLTGLPNRRHYDDVLCSLWQQSVDTQQALVLTVFDIDDFKQYNDQHGHALGDTLLKRMADVLAHSFNKPGQLVARYGGEEFVVLMPNICRSEAMTQINQCLSLVAAKLGVTLSAGCAAFVPTNDVATEKLFLKADQALYRAKQHGKNRLVWSDDWQAES